MSRSDRVDAELAAAYENFQQQLRTVAEIQQRRAQLTASASVQDKRITVTVNADGILIQTEFASDIDDLTFGEIADGMTQAVQQAAAEVARLGRTMMEPLIDRRARLPRLSELVPGMSDLVPIPDPPVSTAPPNAPERRTAEQSESGWEFTDVEDYDHGRGSGATGWSLG